MLPSTAFSSVFLLLSPIFPNQAFASPAPELLEHEVRTPYNANVTPRFAPRNRPRAAASSSPVYSNTSSTPIITSNSSSAPTPTVPFGITTTVISGTTFTLTYVSTTASQATTIVESDAKTTTTATYSAGAPIWFVPILPIGFPFPPPLPPPIPPPIGGGGGGGGTGGCEFGCDDKGDNPTTIQKSQPQSSQSQNPQSQSSQSQSSQSSSTSSSSSSTVSGITCSAGCTACALDRRDALPTASPEKPKREISNLFQYSKWLKKRNIPIGDGLPDLFNTVRTNSAHTKVVQLAVANGAGAPSSQFVTFDSGDHNLFVGGLEGCTSVIVVSRLGAFMSHYWENPAFEFTGAADRFQEDVLDDLTEGLQPQAATFADIATSKIFIMTPTTQDNNLNGPGDAANGNWPQQYPDRISQITSLLGTLLPNIPITYFVYQRQASRLLFNGNVYGKAMVITVKSLTPSSLTLFWIMYSGAQTEDPDPANADDPGVWDPPRKVWQLYLQSKLYTDVWGCTGNSKRDGGSCPISAASSASSSTTRSSATKSSILSSPITTSSRSSSSISSRSTSTSALTTLSTATSSSKSSSGSSSRSSSSTPTSTKISSSTLTSSSSTTSLPRRTAAPEITITTPAQTPDCVKGYQTYTMPAVASAPANAASLRFLIPKADTPDTAWEFDILPGFNKNPETDVLSWQVGTSATGPPITSGNGGAGMSIKWEAPAGASGTYVELLFTDDPPLGIQTYGVVAKGGGFACMPDACSGPPTVTISDDGLVCTLQPCSTDPDCVPGGPVTPEAACLVVEDGVVVPLWYDVTIVTNKFVTDNGASLKSQEKGCGDLLSWSSKSIDAQSSDGKWTASLEFTFTLPLTIKSGCVERAIASAGGPRGLACVNEESDWIFPWL